MNFVLDFKLDVSHYNAMLNVMVENESEFNPVDILQALKEAGLEPNSHTYAGLIAKYCQVCSCTHPFATNEMIPPHEP